MTANHVSNRRGSNPQSANVVATSVPVLGALVPSRSNPDEKHLVCWSPVGGRASCTCEGWRARGHCYHITTVIQQLMATTSCPACGGRVDHIGYDATDVAACSRCDWAIVN